MPLGVVTAKKLTPEYAKAAQVLKKNDPPIILAKVDATVEKDLAEEYDINGFPTLKIFKSGSVTDYQGGRTESTIISYMKKKSGPSAKTLTTVESALAFIAADSVAVVGFFDSVDSPVAKIFLTVADSLDDYVFGITDSQDVKTKYNVPANTIVVFKTYDEPETQIPITTESTTDELSKQISASTLYLIETFSNDRAKAIFSGPLQIHALIFADKEAASFKALEAELSVVATELKGKLLFVWVPLSESRVYDYFGIQTTDVPRFIISDMSVSGQNKKYLYEGKMEKAEIATFATDVLGGKLSPTLKSEEPLDEDLENPVKVVKGKSFESIVMNNSKDVLLEFYAPWCGHCKSLAPIYDELAEDFEKVETIVIAKMDATANEIDHPNVTVKGFPTIYFFPGNAKDKPVAYSGARDLEGFTKYLLENAVNKFSLDGKESSSRSSVSEEL